MLVGVSSRRVLVFLCLLSVGIAMRDIVCRDPDAGGSTTTQNKHRKFLILGSATGNGGGAGVGNLLIFYPAAYYFAAFTGRDILISDLSILGEMCNIVHCGFAMVSQLALAYPNILNNQTLAHVENVKGSDFVKYVNATKEIDSPIVRADGE